MFRAPMTRNQAWLGAFAANAPNAGRKLSQFSAPNPRKSCGTLLWSKGLSELNPFR
jgi:hypothetical protein